MTRRACVTRHVQCGKKELSTMRPKHPADGAWRARCARFARAFQRSPMPETEATRAGSSDPALWRRTRDSRPIAPCASKPL